MHQPLRLRCDRSALASNYRYLRNIAQTAAGAAVKANGYGLGAAEVARCLLDEGCRDFFVSTWWEAGELADLPAGSVAVLHGIGKDDEVIPGARPVLVSPEQIRRWKESGREAEPCDVMVDTGMNRLGLSPVDLGLTRGLRIDTLHSHLACADEDHPLNARQLELFRELRGSVAADRFSLANSAGILLGQDYSFDLVRPGLALYGGIPREQALGRIRPVLSLEAQVIQTRLVQAGESVGYNATYVAPDDRTIAILNIGYADGYWRAFSSVGTASVNGQSLPVVGRVSMDLVAVDVTEAMPILEGDWISLDFHLAEAARITGYSQYELLTGLGRRFDRCWF